MLAELLSANMLTCLSPPLATDAHSRSHVRVKLHGAYFDGALAFTYMPDPVVVGAHAPMWGPVAGGTAVTLFLRDSEGRGDGACFFDSVQAPLSLVGPSHVTAVAQYRCITPLATTPKVVSAPSIL